MRPIFGALAFILIIFFNEIETSERSSYNSLKEKQDARAYQNYLRGIKRANAAKIKEEEEAKSFSEMLKKKGVTELSSKGKQEACTNKKYLNVIERTEAAMKEDEEANSFLQMQKKKGLTDLSAKEKQESSGYKKFLKALKRTEAAQKEEAEAKLFSEMLRKKGVTEPSLKEGKDGRVHTKFPTEADEKDMEDEKSFSEMLKRMKFNKHFGEKDNESRDFSQTLRRLEIIKPSSSTAEENIERTYGTSRATRRQLEPRPKRRPAPNSEPNLEHAPDENNRLPTFEHVHDRSGGNANEAHLNHYSSFLHPLPHVGGNSLPLYENTVSQVPGDMYMDNAGYYQQVPHYPSPSTGNYVYDHLHQFNGAIPPSGSSYLQSTQNDGHDHSFQSSGVAPSNWPFSDPRSTHTDGQGVQNHHSSSYSSTQDHDHNHFLQGFQDHQPHNYYSSESLRNNQLNEYLINQYPPNYGGSGSGHDSSYPHNK